MCPACRGQLSTSQTCRTLSVFNELLDPDAFAMYVSEGGGGRGDGAVGNGRLSGGASVGGFGAAAPRGPPLGETCDRSVGMRRPRSLPSSAISLSSLQLRARSADVERAAVPAPPLLLLSSPAHRAPRTNKQKSETSDLKDTYPSRWTIGSIGAGVWRARSHPHGSLPTGNRTLILCVPTIDGRIFRGILSTPKTSLSLSLSLSLSGGGVSGTTCVPTGRRFVRGRSVRELARRAGRGDLARRKGGLSIK